jgi:hypothetical protein
VLEADRQALRNCLADPLQQRHDELGGRRTPFVRLVPLRRAAMAHSGYTLHLTLSAALDPDIGHLVRAYSAIVLLRALERQLRMTAYFQ